MIKHWMTKILAAGLAFLTAGAILAMPVSASERGYFELKPTTKVAQNHGAPTTAADPAQLPTVTATQVAQTESLTYQMVLEKVIEEGKWDLIQNYTGSILNINSMAGGVEPLSAFALSFAPAEGTPLTEGASGALTLKLSDVMNGRSLRAGESVQGFLYNAANGYYYATQTQVVGDVVTYLAPFYSANPTPVVIFCVSRGTWSAGAGYDYFAIGNSISMHPKREYWPNAMGMGATTLDRDYFNIVSRSLRHRDPSLNAAAMNYSIWEILCDSRDTTLDLLDPYLSPELDLVSVELGENVIQNRGNFAADYDKLIGYIKTKAPNAQIVLMGTFWQDDEIETVKQAVAAKYGAIYVDISALQNDTKYRFGNRMAQDDNGVMYPSYNEGTAIHPNDAAMQYMANAMLKALGVNTKTK